MTRITFEQYWFLQEEKLTDDTFSRRDVSMRLILLNLERFQHTRKKSYEYHGTLCHYTGKIRSFQTTWYKDKRGVTLAWQEEHDRGHLIDLLLKNEWNAVIYSMVSPKEMNVWVTFHYHVPSATLHELHKHIRYWYLREKYTFVHVHIIFQTTGTLGNA